MLKLFKGRTPEKLNQMIEDYMLQINEQDSDYYYMVTSFTLLPAMSQVGAVFYGYVVIGKIRE